MYVEYPKNIESDKKYMNVFLFPIDKFENDSKDHYLCLALNKYKKINDSFVKNLGLPYVEAKTKNEKEIRNITDIIFGKYAETIQILRLRHFKYNNINININNNIAINYVNRSPELSSGGEFGTPMGGPVD
jgi:predicted aldo/keto reductase-like oxidoreductase